VASNASIFDARADGAAATYCIDMPAVLVGQQICGGVLRSTVTATTDPRGFALGGLAPVPKLSSVPLIIPKNVQGIPVPDQVQAGLKQISFTNIPSQCQAAFPVISEGDNDQTCGGPTSGDSGTGIIASGANARVFTTGDEANPTQTRTTADSRVAKAILTGLQAEYENVRSLSDSGLNTDGNPAGTATMNANRISFLSGAFVINDISSLTKVVFNGTKQGAAALTSFSYGGASFAGIPVNITAKGLELATQNIPTDQVATLTDQLNKALANNNGFGVKLLPAPPIVMDSSIAKATSGGIEVTYRGSTGTDVVYTQDIGITSAQVSAVSAAGAASAQSAGPATAAAPATVGFPAVATPADSTAPDSAIPATVGDFSAPASTDVVGGSANQESNPASGIAVTTNRQIGNRALLAAFPVTQPLPSSRLKNIYPAFCVLLFASVAIAYLRRRPIGR
jgi:hypothetical protein